MTRNTHGSNINRHSTHLRPAQELNEHRLRDVEYRLNSN
jgi:hypothetical protein